ncbi:NUDIX domain-containing protein [Vibrio sp.]|nr:NUDIX domain-containing protein [Vibrio sp.]
MDLFSKLRITQWLSVILSLYVFSSYAENVSQKELKGALCLINTEQGVVHIRDQLTGKFSIPGGTIIDQEDPKQAAIRETWEETGLVVTPTSVVGYLGKAVVYECLADSTIVAFDKAGTFGYKLPIWFAPHYAVEASSVQLIDLNKQMSNFALEHYRFPDQVNQVNALAERLVQQEVTFVQHLIDAAPQFQRGEMYYTYPLFKDLSLQSYLIDKLMMSINMMALVGFIFAMYVFRGFDLASVALTGTVLTIGLSLVAQQGIKLPIPLEYTPFITENASLGLPSIVFALFGFVIVFVRKMAIIRELDNTHFKLCFIAFGWGIFSLNALYGLVSFKLLLSDIVIACSLGALVGWHFSKLTKQDDLPFISIIQSMSFWLVLTIGFAVMVVYWGTLSLSILFALSLSILGCLQLKQGLPQQLSSSSALLIIGFMLALQLGYHFILGPFLMDSTLQVYVIEVLFLPVFLLFSLSYLLWLSKRTKSVDQ